MTVFTKPAVDVFAPTDAAGNPRRVVNAETQVWGTEVERAIRGAIAAGALVFGTKAELDADLNHNAGTGAWVVADPNPENNGIYGKVGASGSGSWEWLSPIPDGPKGWSPLFRIVSDGARRVLELYDWTAGEGVKPSATGFVGANGLTEDVSEAIDIRGPAGPNGPGSGDMLRSVYDPEGKEADAFNSANQDYNNSTSGLAANNVQDAIDEVALGGIPRAVDRAALGNIATGASKTAYLAEQGLPGMFVWQAGDFSVDVAANSTRSLVIPSSADPGGASGAYIRQQRNPIYLDWLVKDTAGAAAANTTAILEVLDYLDRHGGGEMVLPSGNIYYTGIAYTEPRGIKIRGAVPVSFYNSGNASVLYQTNLSGTHMAFQNPAGLLIEDLHFAYSGTPTGGQIIDLHSTHGAGVWNEIHRIYANDHWNGLLIRSPHTLVRDVRLYRGKGSYGVRVDKPPELTALDLTWVERILVDTQASGGSTTYVGLDMGNSATTWVWASAFLNCFRGIQIGTGALFVRVQNCDAENSRQQGILIGAANKVWLQNVYSCLNTAQGIETASSFVGVLWIDRCEVIINGGHGILLGNTAGGSITIAENEIAQNSHPSKGGVAGQNHGITVVAGVSNFRVLGNRLGGNQDGQGAGTQGYGMHINGGPSNGYIVTGNDFRDNQTGGIIDGGTGTNKVIASNLG